MASGPNGVIDAVGGAFQNMNSDAMTASAMSQMNTLAQDSFQLNMLTGRLNLVEKIGGEVAKRGHG